MVETFTFREVSGVPGEQTLGDWRVGMVLWKKPDGTTRLDEILAGVDTLIKAGHPLAPIVKERVEYSNQVLRPTLLALKDALGFTTAEVDESLCRAERVRLGDLSGVWPLPPAS